MRLILESEETLNTTKLPKEINGNYWIVDNNLKNLINIEAVDNNWILKSNMDVKICKDLNKMDKLSNANYIESSPLIENTTYNIMNIMTLEKYKLYCIPSYENFDNFIIDYSKNDEIIIGNLSNAKCEIGVDSPNFSEKQLSILYDKKSGGILLKNLNENNKLFVNDNFVKEFYLTSGDVIFCGGIYIYFLVTLLLVSNNKNSNIFNSLKVNKRIINENAFIDYTNLIDKDIKVFDKKDYYQRPPRFKRTIEKKTFVIDEPTQKEQDEETPLIFTIAPMMTMGMMSMVTGFNSLQKVMSGESTFKDEFASILITITMLVGMIVFPLLQRAYNKYKKIQKELKRRKKYKKYISQKRQEIFDEINFQKQVLIEDNLPLRNVANIILSKTRNLWERKIENNDFLELRLGIGTKKPDIDIKYPEEHFSMEEDSLKDIIEELVKESKDIVDVPITLNFKENNKVGIIANKNLLYKFLDGLMLQLIAFHGYDMLRIVILTDSINKSYWEKFRNLPFLWNNDKSVRYFATNKDEVNKVTSYLKEEYNYRIEINKDSNIKSIYLPYYLIITDDVLGVKNNALVSELLKNNDNIGYSLLMLVDKLNELPNESNMFINVSEGGSGIFTSQMTSDNQLLFNPDYLDFSIRSCINTISNIPLDINSGKFVLPTKYSFLEMFDVGNVNQLNIINRWKDNDIINSLETPVGIGEEGELFKIDLHEKAHGPHGLVAGMTGSGKSEWIITYILSMAINYSPEEVQFVLIDYKGGGLSLTFDDVENNIKLPHVVGTITNLDIVEINRSLASIESELKRRQGMFKIAREELNESSMDIYKYQELYRKGKVKEPMSHLFIISDEFAELKTQQPEFMDKLISTARIGRSLGVHLILATQKPSGIVDDQIWSNSKFKVCLKVQDKSDSMDMLKCPDAAMLKETGRFYLQVGYNELFLKGQAAYAGSPYYESDKKVSIVNSTIDFVDNVGEIIKKDDIEKTNTQFVYKGEELPNVLKYIIDSSKLVNLNIKPLWLSRIPDTIYVDKLKEKYQYQKQDYFLNPIIGEYDYPSKQVQGLLTLPISEDGNILIYGSSGSGKENLLTTLIYSIISNYTINEVNFYIVDYGAGVLGNFTMAPHVGDIIVPGNEEKLNNLFKFINSEMALRKKKFVDYNGNYFDYINNSDEKLPNIVIIFNMFDVFSDLNDELVEEIADLTRDATKFGIYFILTTQSVNGIRSKITQNFKRIITLQLNDEMDYKSLMGQSGIKPSKAFGRGLVKLDTVLEFQTAFAFDRDTLYENIKSYSLKLFAQYRVKVKPIPVLPEVVKYDNIKRIYTDISNIPIGIVKETLNISSINLKTTNSYLIGVRALEDGISFIDKLIYILSLKDNFTSFVFDTNFTFDDFKYNISYITNGYLDMLTKISNYVDQIYDVYSKNNSNAKSISNIKEIVCVIIGIDKFFHSLKDEEKQMFTNIATKTKEVNKIHFIFVDTYNGFKKCEMESWYKDLIDSSCGLWIGDGFAEQYSIKPTKVEQKYFAQIGTSYGYKVTNGIVEFVKLIEKKD